jgi:hypothetical protein
LRLWCAPIDRVTLFEPVVPAQQCLLAAALVVTTSVAAVTVDTVTTSRTFDRGRRFFCAGCMAKASTRGQGRAGMYYKDSIPCDLFAQLSGCRLT